MNIIISCIINRLITGNIKLTKATKTPSLKEKETN